MRLLNCTYYHIQCRLVNPKKPKKAVWYELATDSRNSEKIGGLAGLTGWLKDHPGSSPEITQHAPLDRPTMRSSDGESPNGAKTRIEDHGRIVLPIPGRTPHLPLNPFQILGH
jgi:hypothetical protein